VVEVLELHGLQRALPQPVVEQQPDGEPVADVLLAGDDRPDLVGRERRAVHAATAGAFDRERRVAVDLSAEHLVLEEVAEDREVLVVCAWRRVAPLGV
jgi:hypothetical protein